MAKKASRQQRPRFVQQLVAGMNLQQSQEPFAKACLPLTIEFARRNRDQILDQMDESTKTIPFEDRVLIWLASYWLEDVRRFHAHEANSMAANFEPRKLERFDEHYSQKLELLLSVMPQ